MYVTLISVTFCNSAHTFKSISIYQICQPILELRIYMCIAVYCIYVHCNQERTCWLIYCSLQSPNVISSAQLDNLAMCTFHIFSFIVEEIDLTFITFLLSLWIEFYKHITRCNKLCSIGSSRNVYFPFMLRIQNIQTALNLFPLVPVHSKIYTVWHTHIQE